MDEPQLSSYHETRNNVFECLVIQYIFCKSRLLQIFFRVFRLLNSPTWRLAGVLHTFCWLVTEPQTDVVCVTGVTKARGGRRGGGGGVLHLSRRLKLAIWPAKQTNMWSVAVNRGEPNKYDVKWGRKSTNSEYFRVPVPVPVAVSFDPPTQTLLLHQSPFALIYVKQF